MKIKRGDKFWQKCGCRQKPRRSIPQFLPLWSDRGFYYCYSLLSFNILIITKCDGLQRLNNYILVCAGERPYRCHLEDCGRAFIQLSNLQQHLRNHDAQVERAKNRPFHCSICGKGFATESSLRTHTAKVNIHSIPTGIFLIIRRKQSHNYLLKFLLEIIFDFKRFLVYFRSVARGEEGPKGHAT